MHGYVADRKSEKAVGRMTAFGRVMYGEMALLTVLGIWVAIRLWPFMTPADTDTFDYILAIFSLLGLVYVMMWTLWGVLFRPITASIMFWKLEDQVLHLDRTVRRHRFASVRGEAARVDESTLYDFQKRMNEVAKDYATEHSLMTRKHELD